MKVKTLIQLPIAILSDITCIGIIKNAIMNESIDDSYSDVVKLLKADKLPEGKHDDNRRTKSRDA